MQTFEQQMGTNYARRLRDVETKQSMMPMFPRLYAPHWKRPLLVGGAYYLVESGDATVTTMT